MIIYGTVINVETTASLLTDKITILLDNGKVITQMFNFIRERRFYLNRGDRVKVFQYETKFLGIFKRVKYSVIKWCC